MCLKPPYQVKNLRLIVVVFLYVITQFNEIKAQSLADPAEIFSEGQFFFQREDYKEALYYFKKLVKTDSVNANYNFKVGECYLNMSGLEHLAVPYLEKAIKGLVPKREYKGRDSDEKKAPLHALFYLGNAYRAAGKLDEALTSYQKFTDSPYFYNNYNLNVVETEIRSCERAKIIQDAPIKMTKEPLNKINTEYAEFNAIKSDDGETMVFVRGLKFYDAIFVSYKQNKGWSSPVNISQEIVSDGDFYPTGLSADGTKLLLVREKDQNADIYVSTLKDSVWSKAKKLEGKINSLAQETHATFGIDDHVIYLVSDRQGSIGGKDIFVSELNSKDVWGKPRNLGKTINTEFDEETPILCENGKTLFFSSKGHYNMGGYDIFYSYRKENKWSVPKNIGYPLNTTCDDLFYMVDENCKTGLYSVVNPERGISDMYEIKVVEPLSLPLP